MSESFDAVIGTAQTLIRSETMDGPITREIIANAVDRVLGLNRIWKDSVDRQAVIRELETRLDIWIGREQVLVNNTDHVPWLSATRRQAWRYWARYRQFMVPRLAPRSLEAMDRTTNTILSLLEDPLRDGPWDRRGLVVGHVQSGKTSNYTALICKAADAGYKLIIVLAGTHKNLRSQTQMRLDDGFLGYETMPPTEARSRDPRPVGAGLIDGTLRPNYVTNRSDNGDFSRAVANNMGINPGGPPLLFVIKKNARVFQNLLSWVEWVRPVAREVPLLVIDDEADHASVDTREQAFDQDGRPDPDHDPTTINRGIRRLLNLFDKSTYVGYTATPYANVFIHERGATSDEGEDLFPRSFIVSLPAPSNYSGPVRLFGLDPQRPADEAVTALPLLRHVADHADSSLPTERNGWVPPGHRNGHVPVFNGADRVPSSLREAIYAFVLCCAARRAREQARQHNSMLVHVTRFNNVQSAVKRQVESEMVAIRRRLRRGEGAAPSTLLEELRRLWMSDFMPTTTSVRQIVGDPDLVDVRWEDLETHLADAADDIHVREINGSAGDILDYETHRETGFNVIAIGGDKLSRGLTLEGLSVSYFLRASKMYDTLMQMGRWFGYRPGFLDLCRLYTTTDLETWFQHITEANEELRQEFDHMVAVGGTPRDYGLRVRSHPILMVTSQVKMRHGITLQLSFDSDTSETVVFHRDSAILARNVQALESLTRGLGSPKEREVRRDRSSAAHNWERTYLWEPVNAKAVIEFLTAYSTHPSALRVNNRLLAEYIERQLGHGELTHWTVALFGNGAGAAAHVGGFPVQLTKRAVNERSRSSEEQQREGIYIIRRLLSPRDPAIDLDLHDYELALSQTRASWQPDRGRSGSQQPPDYPSARAIAAQRSPDHGLLLLYPIDPIDAAIPNAAIVIGFGISFPESPTAEKISYEVNNVYWTQEFEAET